MKNQEEDLYRQKMALLVAATLITILAITTHFLQPGDKPDSPQATPYPN